MNWGGGSGVLQKREENDVQLQEAATSSQGMMGQADL